MGNLIAFGDARQRYAAAYAAHYGARDLPLALQLYRGVFESHPDAPEAGYARSQIQNIVRAVVPKETLLDAQIEMVTAHLARVPLAGE